MINLYNYRKVYGVGELMEYDGKVYECVDSSKQYFVEKNIKPKIIPSEYDIENLKRGYYNGQCYNF